MKIKLQQVVSRKHDGLGEDLVYWTMYGANSDKGIYLFREVELDVPDLPSDEEIAAFMTVNYGDYKTSRIAKLEEELARLRAQE